ncbi:unnamed protein product [Arabis nemorensis]|uniref:Uncharacterized protein n=1 Tax=Arabis nemorensis TaxID=586526 RepID=A0A565CC15_9BRAS|nr:unnamed protein product [Arabis nemorensis]
MSISILESSPSDVKTRWFRAFETVENGGEEPLILLLIENIHLSRKSGEIADKRIKCVVEKCKEKIDEQLCQGGSSHPNQLTKKTEINVVVM